MAKAEIEKDLAVSADALMATVQKFEAYPSFVDGCTRTEVTRGEGGSARVKYSVSMMKDIEYTLDHKTDAAKGIASWELVQSAFLKKNTGRWIITPKGPSACHIRYEIDIEFTIPVPSLILGGLIKSSLPKMVSNFEKQAKKGS